MSTPPPGLPLRGQYRQLPRSAGFRALDKPRAWLFRVPRDALVDRARTAHPHGTFTDELIETTPQDLEALAPVDALAQCATRTLGELSDEDAGILRVCNLQGQTQRAFAQAHGLSLPAAESRLLRARQRLRERLTTVCQVRFEFDGAVCGHVGRQQETR